MVHAAGGLVYLDGANMNALLGYRQAGPHMGVDVMHFNLHKTFSTPHGGGGPGSGPVAVRNILAPYLPTPVVRLEDDRYVLDTDPPHSIGRVHGFLGNAGIWVRALAYIRTLGAAGLREVTECVAHRNRRYGESKYGIGNRLFVGLVDVFAVRWMQRRHEAWESREIGDDSSDGSA